MNRDIKYNNLNKLLNDILKEDMNNLLLSDYISIRSVGLFIAKESVKLNNEEYKQGIINCLKEEIRINY